MAACKNVVVFNVIRVHIVYVTSVAKHSWTSWPRPLPLCPSEAFLKVGDYELAGPVQIAQLFHLFSVENLLESMKQHLGPLSSKHAFLT